MFTKLLIAAALATVTVSTVQIAQAKGKKPTTCLSFTEMTMPVDGEPTKVAVCSDGAKPVILTTYTIVSVKTDDGATVKAAVGWR